MYGNIELDKKARAEILLNYSTATLADSTERKQVVIYFNRNVNLSVEFDIDKLVWNAVKFVGVVKLHVLKLIFNVVKLLILLNLYSFEYV